MIFPGNQIKVKPEEKRRLLGVTWQSKPKRQRSVQGTLQGVLWAQRKTLVNLNGQHREYACKKGEGHLPSYRRVAHPQEVTAKVDIQWETLWRWLVHEKPHSVESPASLPAWEAGPTTSGPSFLVWKMVMTMVRASEGWWKNDLSEGMLHA